MSVMSGGTTGAPGTGRAAEVSPAHIVVADAMEANRRLGHENLGFLSEVRGVLPLSDPLTAMPSSGPFDRVRQAQGRVQLAADVGMGEHGEKGGCPEQVPIWEVVLASGQQGHLLDGLPYREVAKQQRERRGHLVPGSVAGGR